MTTPAGHDDELTVERARTRLAVGRAGVRSPCSPSSSSTGSTSPRWAARLPAIRDGLDFSPAQMGLLLLVGSVGSLVALPLSGMVVERLGARRTVLAFACLNASGLIVASVGVALGEVLVVGFGLVMFGVGTGVWDASMNVEGAVVEQHLGRTVMPRYHAGFSFGTVAAAGIAAVAAGLHVPVVVHVPVAVVLSVIGVAFAVRAFLPIVDEPEVAPRAERAGEGRPRRARRLARAAHAAHRARRPRRRRSPRGPRTTGSASRSSTASTSQDAVGARRVRASSSPR